MRMLRALIRAQEGFALFSVTAFLLVEILSGLAFLAMVSYEAKAAVDRNDSSAAFYLADGAIERARAKFLEDGAWRDGWTNEPAGRGTYDLALSDTTYLGQPVVRLRATGHVGRADRCVEVMAQVPPTAADLTLFVGGDANVGGNLTVIGNVHVNGAANFGSHLKGDPHVTTGFRINPPIIYTDPTHFPGATYYYVNGVKVGSKYEARIFDRNLNDITGSNTLSGKVSYTASTKTYSFSFTSNNDIDTYFDEASGVFRRASGDQSVVVNFGEPIISPADSKSAVVFKDKKSGALRTTIINTRFTGVVESDRLDSNYWFGGDTQLKQMSLAPRNGIALIAYDAEKAGGSLVELGTADSPALLYVTHDILSLNSNFSLTGSAIILNDWNSTGGPNLVYNGAFIPMLPPYLSNTSLAGVSATLKTVRWREVPVGS